MLRRRESPRNRPLGPLIAIDIFPKLFETLNFVLFNGFCGFEQLESFLRISARSTLFGSKQRLLL